MASHRKLVASWESLPFFPKFETELMCQDKLRVTWFEVNFSQSRYNFEQRGTGSNACTIIAIVSAAYCFKYNVSPGQPQEEISPLLIKTLAHAILDGNQLYFKLHRKGALPSLNLSIPEAIKFSGKYTGVKEWKSILYMQPLQLTLHVNLCSQWDKWKKSLHFKKHPDLYVVLICENRSVLFVLEHEAKSITVIDSHQHNSTKGAVIASVNYSNAKCLCSWLAHIVSKYYNAVPTLYELSFLYFRR